MRTVAVRLRLKVDDFTAGAKKAADSTKDLTKTILTEAKTNEAAFQDVGGALLGVGTAAGIGVGLAVKSFADFDSAMSEVRASTRASAADMDALGDAAIDAGARTSFSATEAAQGIDALAKAGVSTADILEGGLNGALDLAAAGSLEVADAAEIASTALTQFKLKGSDVTHVADLLAAGAGKAQGSVGDLGMALKQGGLVASQVGLSIEETTAGLAAFASAGLIGSDAGTSFKSMLQRLTPQSEQAATLMENLGISAFDAQGEFVGLERLAGTLRTAFKDLTPEARNTALSVIFGSDAVRGASVLYEQGAEGIAEWTEKVNDAGYAQETAAIKLDNLKGDLEALSGSVETALIGLGESGDGMLRSVVRGATGTVNAFSSLPGPIQSGVLAVGAFTAAVGLAGGAALYTLPKIAALKASVTALGLSSRTTALLMGSLRFAAVGAAAAGAVIGVEALDQALSDTQPTANAFRDALADLGQTGGVTGALTDAFGKDLSGLAEQLDRASQSKWFSLDWGTSRTDITEAREAVGNLDAALAELASGGNAEEAEEAFRQLAYEAERQGVSLDDLKARFPLYADALMRASSESKLTEGATGALTGAVEEQAESLGELIEKTQQLANTQLGLRGGLRAYEGALDAASEAVRKNGRTLDITTEKGRDNADALDAIAIAAGSVVTKMIEAGAPAEQLNATLIRQREALRQAAVRFGMTATQAQAYVNLVLRIPEVVNTTISVNTAASIRAIEELERRRNSLLRNGSDAVAPRGARPQQRASGGWITGPGGARDDFVDVAASPGEFMVNARSASQNAALLEAINAGGRVPIGALGIGTSYAPASGGGAAGGGVQITIPTQVYGDAELTGAAVRAAGREVAWAMLAPGMR